MIKIVLDALIPGDSQLRMPPASILDFNSYEIKYGIQQIVIDFLFELTKISNDQFSKNFNELDEDQRMKVLNASKLKNIRLFSVILKHVFRAYYSDKRVLSILKVGSSPPFPDGNVIEEDDWTILLPVYERGSIYREFDED
jgi:hypothetical protein